jgi:hypothetical protein
MIFMERSRDGHGKRNELSDCASQIFFFKLIQYKDVAPITVLKAKKSGLQALFPYVKTVNTGHCHNKRPRT